MPDTQTDSSKDFGLVPGMPILERIVIDPESGEELLFRANTEDELDGVIDDYFDPFYDNETGEFID